MTRKEGPEPAAVAVPVVTDAEREALTFTRYDLDVHLAPAESRIAVRTGMTVRNDGGVPLHHVALQISSSLHWESLSLILAGGAVVRLPLVQHTIHTAADHTGDAQEAVLSLQEALPPGASVALTAIYSGTLAASAERLEQIGVPVAEARFADWDEVAAEGTYLRGFGQVLWYPAAGAPVFLGDGAKFFEAVGRTRLRQAAASVRLRLAVEYTGEPPDAAYFCGRREPMKALSENADVPVAEAPGIAVAEFGAEALGFRTPSLFVTERKLTVANGLLVGAVTENTEALEAYAASASRVQPLLAEWLGASPDAPLTVLDHAGQPFEDDALLVTPMRAGEAGDLDAALVHSLTHAWFRSAYPWMDEGLPQFMGLLWMERTAGRKAALAQLQSAEGALALAEPDLSAEGSEGHGQSLVTAWSEVYYRTKAEAVWWMLRGIAGDEALRRALQNYARETKGRESAGSFERSLEKASGKDLRWFFADWVDRDRGLPDLSIVSVTPRAMPAVNGKGEGWLVAVEVRNDGDAAAEVPVTVRSGSGSAMLSKTERLRIRGRSSGSTRILFESRPEEVLVNDGGVPEVRESVHRREIVAATR